MCSTPFAGTSSTAEACLTLSTLRRFFGGDKDERCVQAGEQRCLYAFLRTILGDQDISPFHVGDDIITAADTYFKRHFSHLDIKPSPLLFPPTLCPPDSWHAVHSGSSVHYAAFLANLRANSDFVSGANNNSAPYKWPKGSPTPDLILTDPSPLQAAATAPIST